NDATAAELGFDACLPKPVRQFHLAERLAGFLPATPGNAPVATIRTASASGLPQARILLAEDNKINQMLALAILKQEGHRVDIVVNGLEAIDAVKNRPYDLVVMDVRMPEMDGLEATRRIRALPQPISRLPVIAMTADVMAGDRERCIAAGMDDYIPNPCTADVLLGKDREWAALRIPAPEEVRRAAVSWQASAGRRTIAAERAVDKHASPGILPFAIGNGCRATQTSHCAMAGTDSEVRPPPLAGIRVLDFTRVLAGPWCSLNLADLGAEVIKVENPNGGDDTRAFDRRPELKGEAPYFLFVNRNKRSLAVDFSKPEGREIIRRLARDVDILIENFRPDVMARQGLDYAALAAVNPRLIYCSISGYGHDSPLRLVAGYDPVAQAESGLMSVTGEPDGEPMRTSISFADIFTGMFATQAILAALRARDRDGKGQFIDL